MEQTLPLVDTPSNTNARAMLALMVLAAVCLLMDLVVGSRSIDIGTDTYVYAGFFDALRHHGTVNSRFEPIFYYLSMALANTGMGRTAYQSCLFLVMIGTVVVATRKYYDYLQSEGSYLTFLTASLMFLLLSPVMSNASINVVRQGLASLLVFAALIAFYQRQWRSYLFWGLMATGFHYSSLLYLAFAPVLLLRERTQRLIAIGAFLAYCSGLTMLLVQVLAPPVYAIVMKYDVGAAYRTGVRLDFAVFSLFWYLLPYGLAPLVHEPARQRIKDGTAIYAVMLLAFFAVGWGNFSNRYLLSSWLSVSLVLAAICCNSRLTPLRNPLLIRIGLIAASGVFYLYVSHGFVI
ncbi:EpsG family protein [Frateuria sp. STR12]|uniref:EpsG family protein n=1 Tax=Frateuria hangzhouensis TaxID=2995589 RepID=UPI002260EBE3|nr:EpsG family protein [Frateuria sp. STR12]MCX7513928.1 EpsG family protein [Frateuria sp. STR12]